MTRTIFTILILTVITQAFGQTLKDCSTCSTQIIKENQIKDLSIDEIRFLTNDLFARRGYKFANSEIDGYYSEKSWYKSISDNSKIIYNSIEKQNIKLFQDKTTVLKSDREKLITELKNFKSAILSNSRTILTDKFNFSSNNYENNKDILKYISESLQKINIDDINWTKHKGIYRVTVDNGDFVMVYEISIDKNKVAIRYANQGGSEFGESLYPTDMINEFVYFWNFEWKNNQLKFVELIVAG
ncbi:hypothetical protein J2X31_003570 [Flavobacterium arsenatis]|uniref:YARHG domain-containing protein n=1 Tax=Flavobacterium arsenatis TaxID=1484332 RepID=A0ABU1TUJ4_9FLAO|nr:YARHG domain-containing protein [Flavobacterium arsenatis]MDR6969537.1 hypothetical protein [Flavobacterium arsenatis]